MKPQRMWLEGGLKVRVLGVDEAGRGCLAGPVVAAAVGVCENFEPVEGIDDSKVLSPKRRKELFFEIVRRFPVGIGFSWPDEIDRINILKAALLAMKRAVEDVLGRFCPDEVWVDGRFPIPDLPIPQRAIVKGDRGSFAVACASIVAKVVRDSIMEKYSMVFEGYGFEKNKGYPTKAHVEAIRRSGFTPIHRRTFRPKGLCRLWGDIL